MTEKERTKMVKAEADPKKSKTIKIGNILRKEVVKALNKDGYEVSRDDFQVRNFGCKTPFCLEFVGHMENRSEYDYGIIFDYSKYTDEWKGNDLSLRKTVKSAKDKSKDSSVKRSVSFKEFEKLIKNYCKENGKYNEPEEELEEDGMER